MADEENGLNLYVSADKEDPDSFAFELDNIQKTYLLGVEGVPALRGVSLKVKRGEFVAIYGTSGGGKTSLLNVMGTIDKPTKGHLTICGSRIGSRTKDSELANVRLKRMGFVFQTFNLLSTMTALENVEMPMILLGNLSAAERRKRATELLEKVGMGQRLHHVPAQLSGGEQQRVTIARAIANKPEILLLDEPTGDLDTKNTLIVMEMLMKLNEDEGITLVMVTHDPMLKNAASKVVYMRDGKIHKIETVPEQDHKEFREKCRHELEGMGAAKAKSGKNKKISQLRQPHDYETFDNQAVHVADALLKQFNAFASPQVEEKAAIAQAKQKIEGGYQQGEETIVQFEQHKKDEGIEIDPRKNEGSLV